MSSFSLQRQLLISMPQIEDDVFLGTVIYLHEHDSEGALGYIINRPLEVSLNEILTGNEAKPPFSSDNTVYLGGPVSTEKGFILLPDEHKLVAVHGDRKVLERIENKEISEFLFCLGYSGWDAGQLERELKDNVWLSCDANHDILFRVPPEQRYEQALQILGVDINSLMAFSGNA